jgi:glyoxylase I family protein
MLTTSAFARLCRARDRLREVHERALTIDEVAREAAMSPFHFIRQFNALFGDTPHQFRIQARLDRAKELLALGSHSVTEVCLDVGCSSLGTVSLPPPRPLDGRRTGRRAERAVPGMPHADGRRIRNFREAPAKHPGQTRVMRIKLASIMVDDQDKALKFYTEVFRFVKKHDIPVGVYRWITVVSPEGPDDLELALEPNANPVGKAFQEGLFKQGIPATAFEVENVEQEYERLRAAGVVFTQQPHAAGPVTIAVCADTCGNLIQLYQPLG